MFVSDIGKLTYKENVLCCVRRFFFVVLIMIVHCLLFYGMLFCH